MQNATAKRVKSTTVRPNYQVYQYWTFAEAGRYLRLSTETVRQWLRPRFAIDGRIRLEAGNRVGPLKINRDSLLKYIRTGTPQGPQVSE